jgi:hypothetical protein
MRKYTPEEVSFVTGNVISPLPEGVVYSWEFSSPKGNGLLLFLESEASFGNHYAGELDKQDFLEFYYSNRINFPKITKDFQRIFVIDGN